MCRSLIRSIKVLGRWIIESKNLPADYLFTRNARSLPRACQKLGTYCTRRSAGLQHGFAAKDEGGLYLRADPRVGLDRRRLSQRQQKEGAGNRAEV
jgi:hypothetical protein